MNRFTTLRKVLPIAFGALLLTFLLAAQWRPGDASTAMDRLFQSVLQPTATPGARQPATVAPTATTRGSRSAPTATPAARMLTAAHIRRLPLVLKGWPPMPTSMSYSGFKGVGDDHQTGQPKPGMTALNPDWWWDWTFFGNGADPTAQPYWGKWLNHNSNGPYPNLSRSYVPMLWCPSMNDLITDELVRTETRQHPGSMWFLFNEPDMWWFGCGPLLVPGGDVITIAKETARRYVYYWNLIKAADPTAKVFCCGNYFLPMPSLGDTLSTGFLMNGTTLGTDRRDYPSPPLAGVLLDSTPAYGRLFWETFILNADLANHPLDGLHIHVYPGEWGTQHPGCPVAWPTWHNNSLDYVHFWAEWSCAQDALVAAYTWFEAQPMLTGRPIWIGETGSVDSTNTLQQTYILAHNMNPMEGWLMANTQSGNVHQWINAVAWFTTYSALFPPTSLLMADLQQSSTLGQDWAIWSCSGCENPR